MKLAPLIPLRLAPRILRLARAKLPKILGCFGNDVFEEFHLDATELFSWVIMSVTTSSERRAIDSRAAQE